jgi:hypothetical protein
MGSLIPPSIDSGLDLRGPIKEEMITLQGDLSHLWPPQLTSSAALAAGKTFIVVMSTAVQKFADFGAQVKKRSHSSFGPEGITLQNSFKLFPEGPVTEEAFDELLRHPPKLQLTYWTNQIFAYAFIQAWKDLFEPVSFQYLQKVVVHPDAVAAISLYEPDLFRQLPGRPDNALHTVSMLHQRIYGREELWNHPTLRDLYSAFEDDLLAILNEKGAKLFRYCGIGPVREVPGAKFSRWCVIALKVSIAATGAGVTGMVVPH